MGTWVEMLKKKLSRPKIRYERQKKKTYLLFYYFFAYLFLSQYGRKYCMFGTKMTGKLHVQFQYILDLAPFGLIPGPLGGIILTGVHLVSVFSNKHTVTHAIFEDNDCADCSASWKQICFRFRDLCFPLLHGLPLPRKKTNKHSYCRTCLLKIWRSAIKRVFCFNSQYS